MNKQLPLFCMFICMLSANARAQEWQSLFNGEDLTGWKIVLKEPMPGYTAEQLVTVEDGEIRMYDNVPADQDLTVPFGVILTDESYSRFHFRVEYRWMGDKYKPRADRLRDAGMLFHCYGREKIWPDCVECQIQEGDTGDIVLLGSRATVFTHPDPDNAPRGQGNPGMLPELGGVVKYPERTGGYYGRLPELDNLEGWTTVEVIVHGSDYSVFKVNGQAIARLYDMQDKNGQPLGEGRLALQLEAAEIAYRNVEILELPEPLKPSTFLLEFGEAGEAQKVTVTNPSEEAIDLNLEVIGADPEAFTIGPVSEKTVEPGASVELTITLSEDAGDLVPALAAGIQIGSETHGCFVALRAVKE